MSKISPDFDDKAEDDKAEDDKADVHLSPSDLGTAWSPSSLDCAPENN